MDHQYQHFDPVQLHRLSLVKEIAALFEAIKKIPQTEKWVLSCLCECE